MTEQQVFNRDSVWFTQKKAAITAKAILQQPRLWEQLADTLEARKEEISAFMEKVTAVPGLRVVFTGAGSSAFIGESLQQLLAREMGLRSESVHTTEIVSAPQSNLFDVPTLLVSFARSGDSPESTGTLRYASKYVHELYNLVVVCNKDSALANYANDNKNTLVLNMPQESCDKGFAMTSSVSCMSLATWAAFGYKELERRTAFIRTLAESARKDMPHLDAQAQSAAEFDYRRVVYLGTGALRGLARESAVKSLELTHGIVNAVYDTPTGFRHGPKTVLNNETCSVHFISPVAFTQRYDVDLANELANEKDKNRVMIVVSEDCKNLVPQADTVVTYAKAGEEKDSEMNAYIKGLLFAQLLSLEKSLERGITTDNPCPDGAVNRVVKGVTIYEP